MAEPATTKAQRDIMSHAIDLPGRIAMGRIKAAKWRKIRLDSARNVFCFEVGGEHQADIEALVAMGLMVFGVTINEGKDRYAYVTQKGMEELGWKPFS